MESISDKKIHFAPLARQTKTINKLLRQGKFRNVSQFMRCAVDHYLDRLGAPTLSEQARMMAEDFQLNGAEAVHDPAALQDDSRASNEDW